jgi:hypothetical protein
MIVRRRVSSATCASTRARSSSAAPRTARRHACVARVHERGKFLQRKPELQAAPDKLDAGDGLS